MRPTISIITALAVNLHLWLGCCAHHAHGSDGTCDAHEDCNAPHAMHDEPCGHQHDGEPAPDQPAAPWIPAHDDCHESHCSFLIAGALAFSPDIAIAFMAIEPEPAASAADLASGVTPRDRDGPFDPNVRPHLVHQVFLN